MPSPSDPRVISPSQETPLSITSEQSGRDGLHDVFPSVYQELRRVAHRHLRGEQSGHTLGTTGLVHEAYLELAKLDHVRWHGRGYVLAAASRAMRRILVDYAVARRAQKRGGGVVVECRFYGGMSVEETAEALETSPATVKRDWTVARAWLNRELGA